MPFVPGRRPTDEDTRLGLGSSDNVAMVTGDPNSANRAVLLVETADLPSGAAVDVTISVDGTPLPAWNRRPLALTSAARQRIELAADRDLASIDLGLTQAFLRRALVEVRVVLGDKVLESDTAALDVCDVRNLGSLYQRIIDRLVAPDTAHQAQRAGVADPGVAYHPWFPVLKIGGHKAALYTEALVADIVGKQYHLTDPAWLLRVGIYLELLTCVGIFEAVRSDVGDLLEADERAAFEHSPAFDEVRKRINPDSWREIWGMRRITFPGIGSPRTGPVSVLNLLKKKNVTMRFLHTHHDDLKHAIELAGANAFNAQETWQRVFRDAERAVMRQTADAFPELGYLPAPAREIVLWQKLGFAGQQGVYPTACNQYRASMNHVADWAKGRGLMDHAGDQCIPPNVSLIEAQLHDPARVAVLQRQDGLSPRLDIPEPAPAPRPTTDEMERLLAELKAWKARRCSS